MRRLIPALLLLTMGGCEGVLQWPLEGAKFLDFTMLQVELSWPLLWVITAIIGVILYFRLWLKYKALGASKREGDKR